MRRKRCEECGKLKSDVERVEDPFTKEITGETVMRNLCVDCVVRRTEDI